MAKQTINLGTTPNDHTGDAARTAFDKVNDNFDELYAADTAATAAIAAEATARAAADTTLQTNITAEASTRAAADTTNANAISAETTARQAADTTLQTNITSEANTRAAADTTNANAITTEATARAAADTTLQTNIDAKLNANDASVTNARTPTGGAGGVLSGTYPNPGFAVDMATQSELDAVEASKAALYHAHGAGDISGLGAGALMDLASQAEAEAGTADNKLMTPERTAQAIAALGGGGGGDSFPSGVVMDYFGASAPTGWLLLDGKTIGNASSGATGRANADTSDLFTLLWNSMANAQAPVSGGRGASAAADFAANKALTIPDARGRVLAAPDAMGGSAAERLSIPGTALGAAGGGEYHHLEESQIPAHSHTLTHTHDVGISQSGADTESYSVSNSGGQGAAGGPLTSGPASTDQTSNTGGGESHPNVQPTLLANKIIKL